MANVLHPTETAESIADREIFAAAAALPAGERAAYLDSACEENAARRGRLAEWLRAHESSGFMETRAEAGGTRAEEAGERIGNYELLERIGEGGFGVVWAAEQVAPVRRRVALKIIKLGMDTREVVARFEQERQALAMMDHPNIAKVFDAGATPAGRPFFVMELVPGMRITDFCDEHRLTTGERLQLFIAVCQAVQHAHQKGIIHRDLKPSNILVRRREERPAGGPPAPQAGSLCSDSAAVPKVIDFGVAKATAQQPLTDLTLFTHREQLIGTPLYMSPEQAEFGGADIDTRSDIYSLGVLLYELLTGRTPFDPETLLRRGLDEIRRVIREQEPRTPSFFLSTLAGEQRMCVARCQQTDSGKLASRLRGDLDAIVMKALEKDRTRRYETANGLALDLQRHLANEPVLARPASPLYRARRMVRRNRLAFAAGAIVALAILAGFGFSTWSFLNEQEQRRVAESERRAADKERRVAKAQELAARQRHYVSDINLAHQALLAKQFGRGRRLLDAHRPRAGEVDLRGWEWRWLWQEFRGAASATLSRRTGRATSVSFSPDSAHVAVGWTDGRVEICEAGGGGAPPRLVQQQGPAACVAFSPVAKAIVFSSGGGVIKRHDLATNQTTELCRAPATVHDLAFSRDGTLLALLTRTTGGGTPWPEFTPRASAAARPSGSGRGGTMAQVSEVPETVLVVNAADGRILHTLAVPAGSAELFNNVRLSPDLARLYVTCGTYAAPRLLCLRLADGQTLWENAAPTGEGGRKVTGFTALDLSPDGQVLATGTGYDQRAIQIWDALTGARRRTFEAHRDYVTDLAFSPDGRTLASASSDETVRLWDTRTWSEAAPPLCGNGDEVEAVAFSPDGRRLTTGSRDGRALLWEPAKRPPPGGRHRLPATTLFSFLIPGGRAAYALKWDGRSLIDVATRRETPVALQSQTQGIFAGPNFIGYPDAARGLQLYEITAAGAQLLGTVPLGRTVAESFAYSPEARLLAWAEPGSAIIHVTALDAPYRQIDLTADGEKCVPGSFDPTGRFLLGVGPGGDARVWEIASRQRLPTAEDYFSPFGMLVFGNLRNALGTRAIRDWVTAAVRAPAAPRRFTRTAPAPPGFWPAGSITSRAYSPDGRITALATESGSVLLFNAERQEKIATLHGRAHAVFAVAFTPDGDRVVSANDAIWDVATGQELFALSAEGALHSVAQFSDDGNTLLVGSWHGPGEYQFWRAPSWEEIAEAESAGGGWARGGE